MKAIRLALLPALAVVVMLALISGCTDRPTGSKTDNNNVAIIAKVTTPDLLQYIGQLRLTVSASDMDTIVTFLELIDQHAFEGSVNVPAGADRKFTLEALAGPAPAYLTLSPEQEIIIYRGESVAAVRPNQQSQVNIVMEPSVPMVRLSPRFTALKSGSPFALDLEVSNVPNLISVFVQFRYTNNMVGRPLVEPISTDWPATMDPSVTRYSRNANLDDYVWEVNVYDGQNTGIVDVQGNGVIATINFGSEAFTTAQYELDSIMSVLQFRTVFVSVDQSGEPTDSLVIFSDETYIKLAGVGDSVITFADSVLEDIVRNTLYPPITGPITLTDALQIQTIYGVERGVTDLSGIEALSNLRYINLDYGRISSLAPIANLDKLNGLQVSGNNISSLAPIANLIGLRYVDISYNPITNITPLSGLTMIYSLDLSGLDLTNLGPLGAMNELEYFAIMGDSSLTDISALAGKPIQSLTLQGCRSLSNIDAIADMPDINTIDLSYSGVTNIKALVDNPGLGTGAIVYLYGCSLDAISSEQYLATLKARGVTYYWP
jgi:hypothetical protein